MKCTECDEGKGVSIIDGPDLICGARDDILEEVIFKQSLHKDRSVEISKKRGEEFHQKREQVPEQKP